MTVSNRRLLTGFLIVLLWFLALFEPYGLRLRHLIMGFYKPDRAKIRALWLCGHILKARGGYMKFARRKLHRTNKNSDQEKLTFRYWIQQHVPIRRRPKKPQCLLCGAKPSQNYKLFRCETPDCPGIYCAGCFRDIGQICTICKSPVDYRDFSDISLESLSYLSDSTGYSDENVVIDASVTQLLKKKKKDHKLKAAKTLEDDSALDNNVRNTQSLELLLQEYEDKIRKVKESKLNTSDESVTKKAMVHSSESDSESSGNSKDGKPASSSNRFKSIFRKDKRKCFKILQKTSRDEVAIPKIKEELSKTSPKPWNYRRINFNIISRFFKTLLSSYYKIERGNNHGSIEISRHKGDKTHSNISEQVQSFGPFKVFKNLWRQMRRSISIRRKPSTCNYIICKNIKVEDFRNNAFDIGADSDPDEEITIFSKYNNNIELSRNPQTMTTHHSGITINKKMEEFSVNTETNKTDDFDDWWSAIIESGNTEPNKGDSKICANRNNEEKYSVNRGKNVTFFKPCSAISEASDESMQ